MTQLYAAGAGAAAAAQALGAYSASTSVVHVQPVNARVRVMVLFNTGPGALRILQAIEPVPSAALPVADVVQLEVVVAPPILSSVTSVP